VKLKKDLVGMTGFNGRLVLIKSYLILLLTILLTACSNNNYEFTHSQVATLQPIYSTDITDGSSLFYEKFCYILKINTDENCEEYIYIKNSSLSNVKYNQRLFSGNKIHFVVVPGVFGECIIEDVAPFQFAIPYIENKYSSVSFSTVPKLSGRASSEYNAGIINDHLSKLNPSKDSKVIILAYSKGVTDTLFYLKNFYSKKPQKLDAIVSISGVVNGTFIADYVGTFGDKVGGALPLKNCPTKDNSGIANLTMANQFNWLAQNKEIFTQGIPMFSLVTASSANKTSAVFKPFHSYLNSVFGSNDGQVNTVNQILPKSTFLGVMNADHWAIILPFSDTKLDDISTINKIVKSLATKNRFPRKELLESILLTVDYNMQKKTEM
jgi:hypothetical protein